MGFLENYNKDLRCFPDIRLRVQSWKFYKFDQLEMSVKTDIVSEVCMQAKQTKVDDLNILIEKLINTLSSLKQ